MATHATGSVSASVSSGPPGSCSPSTASSLSSTSNTTAAASLQSQQPEAKRSKIEMLAYPADVPLPSRGLIQSLFDEAVQDTNHGDQQLLQDAGLLSFRQVILPALAYQEEQALKGLQSKTQRDCPELKPCVVQARKAVYGAVGAACLAVLENSTRREEYRCQKEAEWRQQAKEKVQQIRDEAEQQRLATRKQLQRELKMKLPVNQILWREEAYLMTQLNKLNAEKQQWNDAAAALNKQEAALELEEKKYAETVQGKGEPNATSDDPNSKNNEDQEYRAPPEMMQVVETATDIRLAALRIKHALQLVAGTVEETEQIRQALYKQYCKDHQFHGYQGIHDPKGLLRALSQSQRDDSL